MNDNPFNILGDRSTPPQIGEEVSEVQGENLREKIEGLIGQGDIVLFMKGNPQFPQCGFSANSVGILSQIGKPFKTFDILSSSDIRQGLKEYSSWPTYPQLYVKGEFVGGNDILTEMYQQGELQELLAEL